MVFKKFKILAIVALFFGCFSTVDAFFPIDIKRPFDIDYGEFSGSSKFKIGVFGETSFSNNGYNSDADKVNIMQLWQEKQSSLAMIKGFDSSTEIGQLQSNFNINDDDGIRGNFIPTGNFDCSDIVFGGQFKFPYNFKLLVHLPIYFMSLKDVQWQDLTKDYTPEDALVKSLLTNSFSKNVRDYGDGLDIGGWSRHGVGDIDLVFHWSKHFPQLKPILKDVELGLTFGAILPTGLKKDEDKVLSVPFGTDGSLGINFGGKICLNWFNYVFGGVKAEFLQLFGNSRSRRIKTDESQTDLLLLEKVEARKTFGFTQHFNIFLGIKNVAKGFFFNVLYDHWRHNDDTLSLFGNDNSEAVANTATSLEEWSLNTFDFKVGYDFSCHCDHDSKFKPKVSCFYRIPIKARRAIMGHFLGVQVCFEF